MEELTDVTGVQLAAVVAAAGLTTSLAQVTLLGPTDPLVLGTVFIVSVLVVFFLLVLLPRIFR